MKKFSLFFLVIYGLFFSTILIKAQDEKVEGGFKRIEVGRRPIPLPLIFQTNLLIDQYISYYQGRGQQSIQTILFRSSRHEKMIRRIFSEEGVPKELSWIQQLLVESGSKMG